ncbi:sulfurtransferase TusA family protein [Roseinatronobacter sp.]
MTAPIVADLEVDAIGLLCPLPVLKARKRLAQMAPGQVLRVLATDPAAVIDIPHFCQQAGHQLMHSESSGAAMAYFIRCG